MFELISAIVSILGLYSYYWGDSRYTVIAGVACVICLILHILTSREQVNPLTMIVAVIIGFIFASVFKFEWYLGVALAICWEEFIVTVSVLIFFLIALLKKTI